MTRYRDLGLTVGQMSPGPLNAITDVEPVRVGVTTLIEGEGALHVGEGPVRTGVTVIVPHDGIGREVLFAKHAAYQPGGDYPLGTNFALYVGPDNFMVEMESMAPVATLKPGQTSVHTETWVLAPAPATLPDRNGLQQLFA